MKTRKTIQFNLTAAEKVALRNSKVNISDIPKYAADELEALLRVSQNRARELLAMADFQRVPSVGIRFAEDLIFLGFYSIGELQGTEGAKLTDAYERKKGWRTDPCVEDQFRLVSYVAETGDYSRKWWNFTAERKKYRLQYGYPPNRPEKSWNEVLKL